MLPYRFIVNQGLIYVKESESSRWLRCVWDNDVRCGVIVFCVHAGAVKCAWGACDDGSKHGLDAASAGIVCDLP